MKNFKSGFFFLPLILLAALALCPPCKADTIYLKNGRKLEGKIVRQTETEIEVEVQYGSVTVKRRDVEKIEPGPAPEPRPRPPASPYSPKPPAEEAGLPRRTIDAELEKYLLLPEEKIDIARGALIIAKGVYPGIDVEKYLGKIDAMAQEARGFLKDAKTPRGKLGELSRYLHSIKRYSYDAGKHFPNELIDTGRGNCVALSVMYLALGERLGMPMYGVAVPHHMFVRYDDGKTRLTVECTVENHGVINEADYIRRRNISPEAIEKKYYLHNMTRKETLSGLLVNRAAYFGQKGDFKQSVFDCGVALDIDPDYIGAFFNRGFAYYKLRKTAKAMADLDRVLELDPKFANAYLLRGIIRHGKGDLDEALADLDSAVSLAPGNPDVYIWRANVRFARKDASGAIEDCDRALELEPDRADAYSLRGLSRYVDGRTEEAAADCRKALEIDSGAFTAQVTLARIQKLRGRLDEAVRSLEEALTINPDSSQARLLLASVYSLKSRKKEMMAELEKAFELKPSLRETVERMEEFRKWSGDEEFEGLLKR